MPLLAFSSTGRRFPAWSMSIDEWDALKADYRALRLTASCCAGPVVPCTSKRGWCFFRHGSGQPCGYRESAEHIVAKTLVARMVEDLGFDVTTETRGPDDRWRADVLVRHPVKGWRVAVEIQLSRCALSNIEDRQDRYAADGVRGAWLVGFDLPDYTARRDLPLFRLVPWTGNRIDPWVASPGPERRLTRLGDFVMMLLTGGVALVEPPAHTQSLSAVAAPATCWKCHRALWLLVAFANAPPSLFAPTGWLPARDLPKVPELLAEYQRALLVLLKAAPDVTVLRPPRRRDVRPELQAYCPECDAPQSLHRLDRAVLDPTRQRCWSLQDGREWTPRDRVPPHWTWAGGSARA
jgi:hypothetical protein